MRKFFNITVQSVEPLRILVMEVENESVTVEGQELSSQVLQSLLPDIRFKGTRIDFIRILYSLCSLDLFVDKNDCRVSDCLVFQTLGQLFGMDLSRYCNDLNRTKQESTNMDTQTAIFRQMEEAFRKRMEIL